MDLFYCPSMLIFWSASRSSAHWHEHWSVKDVAEHFVKDVMELNRQRQLWATRVESRLRQDGKELGEASLEEMERHWQDAKSGE
jgi:hypothetical protein